MLNGSSVFLMRISQGTRSLCRAQTEVLNERIEIPIAVQQKM
jgi:hypothetical protein